MELTRQKILITGGLGFIFSHVTEYFVEKGWEVVVIDNQSVGSHPEIIDGSFKYINEDITNVNVIDNIVTEKPDYVIHAAAISDVDESIRDPYKVLYNNTIGNLNIFEACRRLNDLIKFIYISTDEVYGECSHRKREDELIFPRNPYACSKATGSLMRLAYDNTFQALLDKTAETRFCNVFGPRQDARKILSAIKKSLKEGHAITVHNGGVGYREYLYVKNIPPVLDLILEKGDRVYNVTLNEGYTTSELIEKVEARFGIELKKDFGTRPGMDVKYEMDNSRIKGLGWRPIYSFDEGLEEYLESS